MKKNNPSIKNAFFNYLIIYLIIVGIFLLIFFNLTVNSAEQQFIYLARSFLEGKLYFTQLPKANIDLSVYKGQSYWPSGPLPAIILIPIVLSLKGNASQNILFFILNLFNLYLLYRISYKITLNKMTALWLSFGVVFSTVYIGVAFVAWSWWLSQVLTFTFLLLALNEFFYKSRYFIIGLYVGGAILTRSNSLLSVLFFILAIYYRKEDLSKKLINLIKLISPTLVALGLILIYNYLRFGDLLERGDNLAQLHNPLLLANREYGLWSITHIPANLYYFLLKGPDGVFIPGTKILTFPYIKPDIWGMSIVISSPILVWIFKAPLKIKNVKFALITSASILFVDLGWFSLGVRQYSYRYALDFIPILFIALAFAFKKEMGSFPKIVIVISFLLNLYLGLQIFTQPF